MGINPGNPNFQPFSQSGQFGVSQSGQSLQANAVPGSGSMVLPSTAAEVAVNTLAQLLLQQTGEFSGAQLQTLTHRLLGLPDEFLQTLALLAQLGQQPGQAAGKLNQQQLNQLLAQLGDGLLANLPPDALTRGLQKHVQKALQQLLPLMSSTPQSVEASNPNLKGFQASLQFLTDFSAQLNQSPTQALQTLMALYLPIHPYMAAEPFNAYFGSSAFGGEHDADMPTPTDDTAQLNLIIRTQTYGTVHAIVWLDTGLGGGKDTSTKPTLELISSGSKTLCLLLRHEASASGQLAGWEKGIRDLCKAAKSPELLLRWRLMDPVTGAAKESDGDAVAHDSKSSQPAESSQTHQETVTVYPAGGVPVVVLSAGFFVVRVILAA